MQKKKTNFIIFGQGRSGSNLLRTLLNSHPRVYCDEELFNPNLLSREYPFSKFLIRALPYFHIRKMKNRCGADIYGFKLFSWHLKNAGAIPEKLNKRGWKIIYISRNNILKQSFSGLIGKQTLKYVRTEKSPVPTEVYYLDCDEVTEYIEKRKVYRNIELKALENIDTLNIIYEEDLKDEKKWNETTAKIFQYLGLKAVETKTRNRITDPRPDSERISNFNEIISHLNENGYASLVDDYYKYL